MKDILDKITSYNLFNNLLPGILFVVILNKLTSYSFIQDDIIIGAFTYYFIGLIISRFGSLVIEPILKKVSLLKFADYTDFISASKKDSSIEIFSEINNMYRSFVSMFILFILFKLYELLSFKFLFLNSWSLYILILLLLLIFLLSYKKQTEYIKRRISVSK
ncbi:MAG: hypothetical protein UR80_C0007G0011 [Parcubacteria group bacterium GW2011_GWB1_35_5]|nr:MAG: hypothetical protein UR80_C0007G0011 [Parcubacteria group bacterium GW2011_GWB1_35_5]